MGDPAGISPELAAKLIAAEEFRTRRDLVVFGDLRILGAGRQGRRCRRRRRAGHRRRTRVPAARPARFRRSQEPRSRAGRGPATATLEGGLFATENFRRALLFAQSGQRRCRVLHAVQQGGDAPRLSRLRRRDPLRARSARDSGPASEFNILDEALECARDVAHPAVGGRRRDHGRRDRCVRSRSPTRACAKPGFASPRIAVAGLNPHAGDGGNFGREEIDVIEPAVEAARPRASPSRGRFPSDTVFLRAQERRFRRGADDVSRPGPDRDEADGLRSRRDADGRLPVPDLHARARHGLRHRRQGRRQRRRHARRTAARRTDGQPRARAKRHSRRIDRGIDSQAAAHFNRSDPSESQDGDE